MLPGLGDLLAGKSLLIATAAPAEAKAVRSGLGSRCKGEAASSPAWALSEPVPGMHMVLTGIGKANAAAGVARVLDLHRHSAILNIGIGGALPGADLGLGTVVGATASVYADEGLQTPAGFQDCAALGFPLGPFEGSAIPGDPGLLRVLGPLCDLTARIATVSTCSGTGALAAQVGARTGAVAEAMEGAAIAHVAARLGVPFFEVRAISNTTGDRPNQRWEIPRALDAISRLIGHLAPS
jgi:futalosine hydrolase